MRRFFDITSQVKNCSLNDVAIDNDSIIQSTELGRGSIRDSVISNVRAGIPYATKEYKLNLRRGFIEAQYCILVNVTAKSIRAPAGSLIYNVVEEGDIDLDEGGVLAGVFRPDGTQVGTIAAD